VTKLPHKANANKPKRDVRKKADERVNDAERDDAREIPDNRKKRT
jgi:hypothetical protein